MDVPSLWNLDALAVRIAMARCPHTPPFWVGIPWARPSHEEQKNAEKESEVPWPHQENEIQVEREWPDIGGA